MAATLSLTIGLLLVIGGVLWSALIWFIGLSGDHADYWRMLWGALAIVIGVCIIVFR